MPISFKPRAINPSSSNKALKASICGAIAAFKAGYAVWSFGGLRKRFSLRTVSNSWDHFVSVGVSLEDFAGLVDLEEGILRLAGEMLECSSCSSANN